MRFIQVTASWSQRRGAVDVLFRDPPTNRFHDIPALGVVELVAGGDVVPSRQARATARRGGVLGDEDGMSAKGV